MHGSRHMCLRLLRLSAGLHWQAMWSGRLWGQLWVMPVAAFLCVWELCLPTILFRKELRVRWLWRKLRNVFRSDHMCLRYLRLSAKLCRQAVWSRWLWRQLRFVPLPAFLCVWELRLSAIMYRKELRQ